MKKFTLYCQKGLISPVTGKALFFDNATVIELDKEKLNNKLYEQVTIGTHANPNSIFGTIGGYYMKKKDVAKYDVYIATQELKKAKKALND